MPFNVSTASATRLPAITLLGDEPSISSQGLADWCAEIGRTTADVLAVLSTTLPAKPHVIASFEAEMREEVGTAIDATCYATDDERNHLIQVAWLAFDRRLAVHVRAAPFAGRA